MCPKHSRYFVNISIFIGLSKKIVLGIVTELTQAVKKKKISWHSTEPDVGLFPRP